MLIYKLVINKQNLLHFDTSFIILSGINFFYKTRDLINHSHNFEEKFLSFCNSCNIHGITYHKMRCTTCTIKWEYRPVLMPKVYTQCINMASAYGWYKLYFETCAYICGHLLGSSYIVHLIFTKMTHTFKGMQFSISVIGAQGC